MQTHTLLPRILRPCTRPLLLLIALAVLCAHPAVPAQAAPGTPAASAQSNEISMGQTLELYQKIPGLTSTQLEYGKGAISRMPYNAQRIFRKICALPGINFESAKEMIELLSRERFTFDQVQTFEALCSLNTTDIKLGIASLNTVKSISFEAGRSFRAFLGIQGATSAQATSMLSQINTMDDLNNRAAKALFSVKGMRVELAQKAMPTLMRLRNNQAKALEAYARIPGMDPETLLDGLELMTRLHQDDAWAACCLFANKTLTAKDAWNWLVGYFALPTNIQETQYDKLDPQRKTVLLQALSESGIEIVWKINNLHAVTDQNGYELSEATLNSYSMKQLQAKFEELPPSVKSRFGGQLSGASHGQAIGILRQATSAGRMQTARDLTIADVYAVMSQGSELYDSSFREILVPVLQARIASRSQGDLLQFLKGIDPGNRLVSDFISSCAQKGKLTAFFPTDSDKQKQILDLVAASAFHNEDSILLFSATFSHLLKVLEPGARTYLISLMAKNTEAENTAFSKLINVILQYYLQTYPELLGPADRTLISRLVARNGAVNLEKYQSTPFAEWKQDGRLGSVSMFHPDDDGRQSFVSNANMLLNAGYRLMPSREYTLASYSPAMEQEIQRWIGSGLPALFNAMRTRSFAVALVKKVGDTTIVHTQFVYSDKEHQMEMLYRFIRSKDEMLAQRGHSYWRSEQIIEPLTKLIEDNRISEQELRAKQRFLSLGSCGGVKVYTTLTRLFASSVDILATIGTGLAMINDPYNKQFFEIIASNPSTISWKTVAQQSNTIFQGGRGQDYLLPGSLTAILHKILDETQQAGGTAGRNQGRTPRS